jgi:hypothetical protein
MNTKKHAHWVRGRAESSMMISVELQTLYENLVNQILNMSPYLWSSLLFVHSDAHAKTNRSCMKR